MKQGTGQEEVKSLLKSIFFSKGTIVVFVVITISGLLLSWFVFQKWNPNYWLKKADACVENGDFKGALRWCNKAVEIDPECALAYSNRARVRMEIGEIEKGMGDCDKAIEIDPGLAIAYVNKGVAFAAVGDYERAIENYTKAIELDSGSAVAYGNRGYSYVEIQEYAKAAEDLRKALELDPEDWYGKFH